MEGVAVLINDEWHSTMIDFECVSSIVLWVKFNFQGSGGGLWPIEGEA